MEQQNTKKLIKFIERRDTFVITDSIKEEIENLINHCDVNYQDSRGYTTIMYIAQVGKRNYNLNILKLLLKKKPNLNLLENEYDSSALMLACKFVHSEDNNYDIIKLLLENGTDVNMKGECGWTALMYICATYLHQKIPEYIDVIELLLENGVDVNVQDRDGNTVLMSTFNYSTDNPYNNIEFVRLLLKYGADTSLKNHCKQTALQLAFLSGYHGCLKLLTYDSDYQVVPDNIKNRIYLCDCCLTLSNGHQNSANNKVNCGHLFCYQCVDNLLNRSVKEDKSASCPICEKEFLINTTYTITLII